MKENMEDWMNPNSDKYYKGFRYKKQKHHESWYDENNVIRKMIYYHNFGDKSYESYGNNKGQFHNEDGYARQEWNEDGKIIQQLYYLNGTKLTEQEWKKQTGKVNNELPILLICDCNSTEHQIVIHKDLEDKLLYLHIHLSHRSFFKRLVSGLRYIFGYKCKYGHFEEFIFKLEHADVLQKLSNFLKDK